MRILHVVEATFAGVGRHVLDLATHQAAAGHDVHIAYSPVRESASFHDERRALTSITWHRIAVGRSIHPKDAVGALAVRRIAKSMRADVIHGHSTKGGIISRAAGLLTTSSVVYTPNAVFSMNPDLGPTARRATAAIERALSMATDHIIAVSPEEQAHLESIGVKPSKVSVVLNGIEPFEAAEKISVRETLGIPVGSRVAGFVGRVDAQKAPIDLVRILVELLKVDPEAIAIVVGDGPMLEEARSFARSICSDHDRLVFAGQQPGTWAMAAFDCFVLPSKYEGFPYVLLEAASLGLPIATTTEANASALGERGAQIEIIERSDAEAAARIVSKLMSLGAQPVRISAAEMAAEVDVIYTALRTQR